MTPILLLLHTSENSPPLIVVHCVLVAGGVTDLAAEKRSCDKKESFGWVQDPGGGAMVSEYACVAIGKAAEVGKIFTSQCANYWEIMRTHCE